jgi:hypothetical protein
LAWADQEEKTAQQGLQATQEAQMVLPDGNVKKTSITLDLELQALESSPLPVRGNQIYDSFSELTQRVFDASCAIKQLDFRTTSSIKLDSDKTAKLLEGFASIQKLHKHLATNLNASLASRTQSKRKSNALASETSHRTSSFPRVEKIVRRSGSLATMFARAKQALRSESQKNYVKKRLYHTGPPTFRSIVWDIFEHNDLSRRATIVNRVRLYVVIASIALFYLQTTPELQKTGIHTVLCRRTIADFCQSRDQPGCYVFDEHGNVTTMRVNFQCAETSTDAKCFGMGYNYGSVHFNRTCSDAFGLKGAQRVCNNRLCMPGAELIADMEPYWVYFESVFGLFYTIEMVLRAYCYPMPNLLWRDLSLLVDVIALFPFYVELSQFMIGLRPIYSVVPTAPSFFTGIRVLKTFRIVKIGTHIPGARVLTRTALFVHRRLTIPVRCALAYVCVNVWINSQLTMRYVCSFSSCLLGVSSPVPFSTNWSVGSSVLSVTSACGGRKTS